MSPLCLGCNIFKARNTHTDTHSVHREGVANSREVCVAYTDMFLNLCSSFVEKFGLVPFDFFEIQM